MEFITTIITNWQEIVTQAGLVLGGISAALLALYKIALLLPGEQPEKTIKAILDFTTKYSKK